MSTALDYDWLREFGWHRIPRLERQPTDHVRRCVALETADDERFLVASEDLCIDLAPEQWPNPRFWFCWITKASSHNSPPHTFVHARHLKTRDDLILLYRGLTGREFGKPNWDRKKLSPVVVFESDEPQASRLAPRRGRPCLVHAMNEPDKVCENCGWTLRDIEVEKVRLHP